MLKIATIIVALMGLSINPAAAESSCPCDNISVISTANPYGATCTVGTYSAGFAERSRSRDVRSARGTTARASFRSGRGACRVYVKGGLETPTFNIGTQAEFDSCATDIEIYSPVLCN